MPNYNSHQGKGLSSIKKAISLCIGVFLICTVPLSHSPDVNSITFISVVIFLSVASYLSARCILPPEIRALLLGSCLVTLVIYALFYFKAEESLVNFFPLVFLGGWNGNLATGICAGISAFLYSAIPTLLFYLIRRAKIR